MVTSKKFVAKRFVHVLQGRIDRMVLRFGGVSGAVLQRAAMGEVAQLMMDQDESITPERFMSLHRELCAYVHGRFP